MPAVDQSPRTTCSDRPVRLRDMKIAAFVFGVADRMAETMRMVRTGCGICFAATERLQFLARLTRRLRIVRAAHVSSNLAGRRHRSRR